MALPKPTAAIARLRAANNDTYDASSNPGGLADGGHRQNWVPNAQAEVDVAEWTASIGDDATAAVDLASDSAEAASNSASAAASSAQAASDSADRAAQFDPSTYAPKASPTFTGDPKAPTPAIGDSDTSIATTAFVQREIARRAYDLNLHYGS